MGLGVACRMATGDALQIVPTESNETVASASLTTVVTHRRTKRAAKDNKAGQTASSRERRRWHEVSRGCQESTAPESSGLTGS